MGNMNPFAFGENSDNVISTHHPNDVFGHNSYYMLLLARILVISTIYFCLTPVPNLHLKEKI